MSKSDSNDVLEQNVSSLLESGGEPPRIDDAARARIRDTLVSKYTSSAPSRVKLRLPALAVGIGLAATAATALVISRVGNREPTTVEGDTTKLADGSTFITAPGAHVTVLGPRRVRVDGAALLDVAPGKGTFVVETTRGRIEVLGTRFVVDGQPDRTTTAVVRGQVKLATDQGDVTLHAGEQAVALPGKAPTRGPAPRLSHLASWAQEARRRDENGGQPVHHGSLFARDPGVLPNGQFREEYPLPMSRLTVDVVVENRVARVALDQTFHNGQSRTLEGVYKFAIPPDASLQRLAMYVDGKLTESAVVERMRARRIYEELVYRRIDPALLEYAGTGRLNLRVYPIPALQDKRLMVAYTQSIPLLYSDWTLTVPLPEVDAPVGDFVVSARIKGCGDCELSAPGQQIAVEHDGQDAIVKLHRTGAAIGDSFVVHVRERHATPTVATKTDGADRYVLVRAPSELGATPREYHPRTWVILDDVSASRDAMDLRAQSDVIDALLRELDEDDRVAVVAFDVQARIKVAPARVADVDRPAVREALKTEGGVGATDFATGLGAALQLASGDTTIVYVGDGVITSGPRTLDTLRNQLAGKAQFVGIGVGDGPDTQTLDALAAATGGYSTTIDLADDLGWRVFDLVAALHTSRVTGVTATLVDAAGALVPATAYLRSPQLADGEEVELVAKLATTSRVPVALELAGTRDGAAWHQRIALASPTNADAGFLPRLWAQRHIAARLLAKHEPIAPELRDARDEQIRQEVVALGKQYFLLSRHTSLLVLENDAMYAQYGVRKGAGDTWAPYAMPATIPVVKAASTTIVPEDVARDAELVRAPLQVFYPSESSLRRRPPPPPAAAPLGSLGDGWGTIGTMSRGTVGHGSGTGSGYGMGAGRIGVGRGGGGMASSDLARDEKAVARTASTSTTESKSAGPQPDAEPTAGTVEAAKRHVVTTDEIAGGLLGNEMQRTTRDKGAGPSWGVGNLYPAHLGYPHDPAYDDLSALVPALVHDAADDWREQLVGGSGSFPIDPAATQLLEAARAKLPSGIYRWGDREIAIDASHHLGWRRTTELGLAETASYDGTAFTRRYAELGLSATRPTAEDDVALAFAYLPIWIADPTHYAKWFVVGVRGPHEVTLSMRTRGKDALAYVLAFDDSARLIAIHDASGSELLSVTWGATGPTSARVMSGPVPISFSSETIADAAVWAHGSAIPGFTLEIPTRVPSYWEAAAAQAGEGTPAWRHAERQLLVSAAALSDSSTLEKTLASLADHGGLELGDVVLASRVVVDMAEARLAIVKPLATSPIVQYLISARKFRRSPSAAQLAPSVESGLVGALWATRYAVALIGDGRSSAAVDALDKLGDRAPLLRLVGTLSLAQRYDTPTKALERAWSALEHGPYTNLARAQGALALYSHGDYDAAAALAQRMVDQLDLTAAPARGDTLQWVFSGSRRGPAGWQIMYAQWRDKVIASSSFEHVLAFVPLAADHPGDLSAVLARAAALAGKDIDRSLWVAEIASGWGQPLLARTLLQPLIAGPSPSPEALSLAADLAQQRGDYMEALDILERVQDASADEEADLGSVLDELRRIIGVAEQAALQSTGSTRQRAIHKALEWGARWRQIVPGSDEVDRRLGSLLLATGDRDGAWRQLSSVIERDPWSGEGYATLAQQLESQGRVADALELWQQAIVIDQTNPTHRLRKAQALIALGRTDEGDALLRQIVGQKWHVMWEGTVYQAQDLLRRGSPRR